MEWELFCEKVKSLLNLGERIIVTSYEEKIVCRVYNDTVIYTKDEYMRLSESIINYSFQPFTINDGSYYESLVDFPDMDSRRRFAYNFEEKISKISIDDLENGINYSFGEASQKLIWFILKEYDNRRIRFPYAMLEKRLESIETKNIFAYIQSIIRLPIIICVQSSKLIGKEQLSKYANSFLFNFAYNLELVLKPVNEMNEIFPKRIMPNRRRINNIDEIVAPKLVYVHELTEHYYMALASSDPFVKFIGFYHIMESFFEDVYNEDVFISVKNIIQHPGFSSKRKKDVAKVIDLVRKKTQQNKEEFKGSELEALELIIKKFVNLSELLNDLIEYDDTLIDYYKNYQVDFSNGDTIDLRDTTNEKLPKKIAARIYKTRNSLVHSKSNDGRINERGIYKPFKDGRALSMELPLLKYIAETVIINSATSI